MRLDRLTEENKELFNKAFALYTSAFPEIERRDIDEQERVMKNPHYNFDAITDGDNFIGIMLYWETDRLIYLEHFAVLPELRNHSRGTEALELLKNKGKVVVLEIEDPVDEITKRRYGFYTRNGFVMTPHYHIQAKYHLGCDDLMLKILSFPYSISREEYFGFINFMTKEIGILPHFSSDVTVRPMTEADDSLKVARLIYLSDIYIYPYWFDSIDDGEKVIEKMIELPTIYNRNNILLSIAENGDIAGALVGCNCPFEEKKENILKAFESAGVTSDKRTDYIFENYYAKMSEDPKGYYVSNITVDPDYRHRGIGTTLLQEAVKDKPLSHLECVKENIGAWRVYQRLGFAITEEYPGVFDVPCYKMIRLGE